MKFQVPDKVLSDGCIIFAIPFFTGISALLLAGDVDLTGRIMAGTVMSSFVSGITAVYAYRSTTYAESLQKEK